MARGRSRPGLGQQLGGGVLGESERLLGAALAARGVALAAVGREDHAAEDEAAAGELREAGDRRAAGAVELARNARSAVTASAVGCVIDAARAGAAIATSSPRISMPMAPCATAGSISSVGTGAVMRSARPRRIRPARPAGSRRRRPPLELAQPRLDVAAQGHDREVGAQAPHLSLAPQRGGADHRALRQLGEAGGLGADEGVAHVLARQEAGDRSRPAGSTRRHVLHGVHGEVDRRRPAAPPRSPW